MQKEIIRVVGANLGLIFLVAILSGIESFGNFAMGGSLIALLLIPINGILCIANFVNGKKEFGKAFLLATGICLLIGFALCASVGPLNGHTPQ